MNKLIKRRRGIFGPPVGTKCIIFIDDISMPQKEYYGAQPPIELLRQFLDKFPWYDRKELVPMVLQDVLLVCAMGPPSTGISVSPRFSRHFNVFVINEFDDSTMVSIFSKILLWHLDTRLGHLNIYEMNILNTTIICLYLEVLAESLIHACIN